MKNKWELDVGDLFFLEKGIYEYELMKGVYRVSNLINDKTIAFKHGDWGAESHIGDDWDVILIPLKNKLARLLYTGDQNEITN